MRLPHFTPHPFYSHSLMATSGIVLSSGSDREMDGVTDLEIALRKWDPADEMSQRQVGETRTGSRNSSHKSIRGKSGIDFVAHGRHETTCLGSRVSASHRKATQVRFLTSLEQHG